MVTSLVSPVALATVFLVAALVLLPRRRRLGVLCLSLGLATIYLGGNTWVVRGCAYFLERQYPPPEPVPQVDCILVLGGGIEPKEPPRTTVELADAGDRILYGARLFREGKAPMILFTGGAAPRSTRIDPEGADARDVLRFCDVPEAAILTEDASVNTYENFVLSRPILEAKGVKRILVVTSAIHMPRSMALARRQLPGITAMAAPTDFMVTREGRRPWARTLSDLIPSGLRLRQMDDVMHEYVGLIYYRLRGWI